MVYYCLNTHTNTYAYREYIYLSVSKCAKKEYYCMDTSHVEILRCSSSFAISHSYNVASYNSTYFFLSSEIVCRRKMQKRLTSLYYSKMLLYTTALRTALITNLNWVLCRQNCVSLESYNLFTLFFHFFHFSFNR